MTDEKRSDRRKDGQQLCNQVLTLEARVDNVVASVDRVEGKIDGIANTLITLIRIEEKQIAINDRLAEGAETMQKMDKRISTIETKLPGLEEKASWVSMSLIGVAGLVGVAVVGLVLIK